jgi:hypothetical protein
MAFRRASYTMVEWRTIEANIKKRLGDLAGYCPQAVMYATLPIFEQSQRIVPVKTGRLKRSGYLQQAMKGSPPTVPDEVTGGD